MNYRMKLVTDVRRALPSSLRKQLRRISNDMLDTRDSLLGHTDKLTPPRNLNFVGQGDYKRIGEYYSGQLVHLCGLQPNHRVLDIGSGVGRIAAPLTRFIRTEGQYQGVDIVPRAIKWCRENISSGFPHFQFEIADIYNQVYNITGELSAENYRFPYEDKSFDIIFLVSVFTHLLPGETENYLSEIARMLKPNGKCLATFFLWNEVAAQNLGTGCSRWEFAHVIGGCRVQDPNVPQGIVCYNESTIRDLIQRQGCVLHEPIGYGTWRTNHDPHYSQDIVVFSRKPKEEPLNAS